MPIFAISDLHLGDGGPRDNFTHGEKLPKLLKFLEHVQDSHGQLIICGDLFEFWQANLSKVLLNWNGLLLRFHKAGAVYIPGNHDVDLRGFCYNTAWLQHPFFSHMRVRHCEIRCSERFTFIHGHEADSYNNGVSPGKGRIAAIYAGLKEDKNGSPFYKGKYFSSVENRVIGRMEWLSSALDRLHGRPSREVQMNRDIFKTACETYSNVVFGHTHIPGTYDGLGCSIYNCGSWVGERNTFVRINEDGHAGVYEWNMDQAIAIHDKLKV